MRPETRKLLGDMRDAAEAIVQFTTGRSLADLASDKLLRSAVYYQFVVIGESLSQLRTLDGSVAEKITEYWRVIGFRNQIIHGYSKIDNEITWRIIQDKLPILRREVQELLAGG